MSYIIASLPPIKCFVKREFLYNFEKGHGELEPAIWVSLKALRGQVFRIESLLPAYGALYDKLPIHAYVWKEDHGDLPIDTLQLWDCMGYRFTIVEKIGLRNLGVKFLGKGTGLGHRLYRAGRRTQIVQLDHAGQRPVCLPAQQQMPVVRPKPDTYRNKVPRLQGRTTVLDCRRHTQVERWR
jgi:hypothetical protein